MKTILAVTFALLCTFRCFGNTAPVPVLQIVNAVQFPEGWGPPNIVISLDPRTATVVVDASGSFDADGDTLEFALGYFEGGRFYADTDWTTDPVITALLPNEESLGLAVSDGQSVQILPFSVNIDTPEEFAIDIADAINERELESHAQISGKQALLAPLERAAFFFRRGDYARGAVFIRQFQDKVAAYRGSLDPALGPDSKEALIAIADELLDAIEEQ